MKTFWLLEDKTIEIANSSKENILSQAESSSLENNLKSKTLSTLPSRIIPKHYHSKFYNEWLSDPKYSSVLKECKNDATKTLCIMCNIQFSIQNKGILDINNPMETKKPQECLKSIETNKHNIFLTILIKKSFSYVVFLCSVHLLIDFKINNEIEHINTFIFSHI